MARSSKEGIDGPSIGRDTLLYHFVQKLPRCTQITCLAVTFQQDREDTSDSKQSAKVGAERLPIATACSFRQARAVRASFSH